MKTNKRILSAAVIIQFLFSQTVWSANFMLPQELGRVTQEFQPASAFSDLPKVIHIQTVHMNYKVQKKIEHILDYLTKEANVNVIALEGADVPIDPDRSFLIDDLDARYKIADDLAKEGQITGAELFAIKSTQALRDKKIRIEGVESRELYQRNLSDLRFVVKNKEPVLQQLEQLKKRTENLESLILPREVQQILQHERSFEIRTENLPQFFHFLDEKAVQFGIEATPEKYPALAKFFVLEEVAKFVEKNELAVMDEWKTLKAEKGLNETESLSSYLPLHEVDRFSFPKLGTYKSYLELMNEANEFSHQALEEAERLDKEILYTLIIKKQELELVELEKDLSDLTQLFDMTLVRDRIERIETRFNELTYEKLAGRLEALENFFARPVEARLTPEDKIKFDALTTHAVSFYQLARERDTAMMNRFAGLIPQTGRAVIITGGFHSDGIMNLLKQKNISYDVILPSVEEVSDHNDYLKAFTPEADLNHSVDTSHLELALTLGDVALEPALIARTRFNLLSAQIGSGKPIHLDQARLGPLPQGISSITSTLGTEAGNQITKFIVVEGTRTVEFTWSGKGLTLGDTTLSPGTVASLVTETAGISAGFGALAPKGSALALALTALMWCASCGSNVTYNLNNGHIGINTPLLDTPWFTVTGHTEISPLPSGALFDITPISRPLTDREVLNFVPYTAGGGPVSAVVNDNAADLVRHNIGLTPEYSIQWQSPDISEMRQGHSVEYAGVAIDINPNESDFDLRNRDPENENAENYAIGITTKAETPGLPPEAGSAVMSISKSVKQPDGKFKNEPVYDADEKPLKPWSLLNWLQLIGAQGEGQDIAEKLKSGEAVAALQFTLKASDIRTFSGSNRAVIEVNFGVPLRAKVDQNGIPIVNENDGTYTRDYRPIASARFVFDPALGNEQVVTILIPNSLLDAPVRQIYVGVAHGNAFTEHDLNFDGLPDINKEYPYFGGVSIANPFIIAADNSVEQIPPRSSGFGHAFETVDLTGFDQELVTSARALAQAIEMFRTESRNANSGTVQRTSYIDKGFGAIELSGIKNGVVTIAVKTREKISKFLRLFGILSSITAGICGSGGCDSINYTVPLPGGGSITGITNLPPQSGLENFDDLLPPSDDQGQNNIDNQPIPPENQQPPPTNGAEPPSIPDQSVSLIPIVTEPIRIMPVVTAPLSIVSSATPISTASNTKILTIDNIPNRVFSAPTTLNRGMWNPDKPGDALTSISWGAEHLGLSPLLPPAEFVALVLEGAKPATEIPGEQPRTFLDMLSTNADNLESNPALKDASGNLIGEFQPTVKNLRDTVALIESTTDETHPVYWVAQVGLDIPAGKKARVTFQIKGKDSVSGKIVTKSASQTLRGQVVETIQLELSRDILNSDVRQLAIVLELGNPKNADGSPNINYIPGGSLVLVANDLVVGQTDKNGIPVTEPGPAEIPLINFEPTLPIKLDEIRNSAPIATLEKFRGTFRSPRDAPDLTVNTNTLNFGNLEDFLVSTSIVPPEENQPSVEFGGFYWTRPPNGFIDIVGEGNAGILPDVTKERKNLVGVFESLAAVVRASDALEFGPGDIGIQQREALAKKWDQMAADARASAEKGYRTGIRAVIRIPTPEGQSNTHVIPFSLKIETDISANGVLTSLPLASGIYTGVPGKEIAVTAEIPPYVVTGDVNATKFTFTIEAGSETFTNDLGEEVPNPTHFENATIEIKQLDLITAEPASASPASTLTAGTSGFGIMGSPDRMSSFLAANPRLASAVAELKARGVGERTVGEIVQAFLNNYGVVSVPTASVLTNYILADEIPIPISGGGLAAPLQFGVLPILRTDMDLLENALREKAGPDAKIGTFKLLAEPEIAEVASEFRPLVVANERVFVGKEADGFYSVSATPESLLRLRAQTGTKQPGIAAGVQSTFQRLEGGLPESSSVSLISENIRLADILSLMETNLTQTGALPAANFFSPPQKESNNNFAVNVVTDLTAENFRQLELDIRENPSSVYLYLDYELSADSDQARYAQELSVKYNNNFFHVRVDDGRRNISGAAEYLSEFFSQSLFTHTHKAEERGLIGKLLKRSGYAEFAKVLTNTFIVASPELVSALNQQGPMQKTPKLILDRAGRTDQEIAALHFIGLYFARLGFAEALNREWLEATADAKIYSTYRPQASFLNNLNALYSSYVTALKTLSISA